MRVGDGFEVSVDYIKLPLNLRKIQSVTMGDIRRAKRAVTHRERVLASEASQSLSWHEAKGLDLLLFIIRDRRYHS